MIAYLAAAIACGVNKAENCVHFVKGKLEVEKEVMERLTEQLCEKQELKERQYQEIVDEFEQIRLAMEELNEESEKFVENILLS